MATAEKTYKTRDKSDWGEGPWQDEPDKVQWIDDVTDLDCLAVRNHHGVWCGYVGVGPEHPLHQLDYQRVEEIVWYLERDEDNLHLGHGGLTFSNSCQEGGDEAENICHVPLPGRSGDMWWFGFDCGHAWDYMPGMAAFYKEGGPLENLTPPGVGDEIYRELPYVREHCADLAFSLRAIEAWLAKEGVKYASYEDRTGPS